MSSVKLTDAATLQAFVQKFDFDLIGLFFHGFASKPFLTSHEGIKGKLTMTQMIVNDVARRYKKDFVPPADVLEMKPRTLEVTPAKIDLQTCPQDYETTYLGLARADGFNHKKDPFEAYMLSQVFMKLAEEIENALWQGDAAAAPADTDGLSLLFDGFLKQIADAIVAAEITAVATGALTLADCVEQFESVYKALPTAMRTKEVVMYCSVANRDLYAESYRENYSKNYMQRTINGLDQIRLDGGNAWVTPIPGMLTSNRIIATVKENMHHLYDAESDATFLNFQDSHRCIDMYGDFKLGCGVGIMHDKMIKVNNQA